MQPAKSTHRNSALLQTWELFLLLFTVSPNCKFTFPHFSFNLLIAFKMCQGKVISPEGRRDGVQPWAQGTWPPTLSNIAPCSTSCNNTQWTNPFVLFPQVFQLTGLLRACSNRAFAILFTLKFVFCFMSLFVPQESSPVMTWCSHTNPAKEGFYSHSLFGPENREINPPLLKQGTE